MREVLVCEQCEGDLASGKTLWELLDFHRSKREAVTSSKSVQAPPEPVRAGAVMIGRAIKALGRD